MQVISRQSARHTIIPGGVLQFAKSLNSFPRHQYKVSAIGFVKKAKQSLQAYFGWALIKDLRVAEPVHEEKNQFGEMLRFFHQLFPKNFSLMNAHPRITEPRGKFPTAANQAASTRVSLRDIRKLRSLWSSCFVNMSRGDVTVLNVAEILNLKFDQISSGYQRAPICIHSAGQVTSKPQKIFGLKRVVTTDLSVLSAVFSALKFRRNCSLVFGKQTRQFSSITKPDYNGW